jgi:hypothetical protein
MSEVERRRPEQGLEGLVEYFEFEINEAMSVLNNKVEQGTVIIRIKRVANLKCEQCILAAQQELVSDVCQFLGLY